MTAIFVLPQACVLTTPPTVDALCISLAKDLRKLLSDADPVLPPSALTSVSKLFCSAVSAELAALPLVEPVLPVVEPVLPVVEAVLEVSDKD